MCISIGTFTSGFKESFYLIVILIDIAGASVRDEILLHVSNLELDVKLNHGTVEPFCSVMEREVKSLDIGDTF
jgi:hypothetical protein